MARIPFILLTFCALVTSAAADTVTVTREGCAALQRYVPSADVEYKPGKDVVNGKPVPPADLDGGAPPIAMPDEIVISITALLQQKFGIPADSTLYKPEAYIGTVTVQPDGRAYFNGKPLQNDAAYELALLCQKQGVVPKSTTR